MEDIVKEGMCYACVDWYGEKVGGENKIPVGGWFTIGNIYRSPSDGYLVKDGGGVVNVDAELNRKTFVKVDFEIDPLVSRYISRLKENNVCVTIVPYKIHNFDLNDYIRTGDISKYELEYYICIRYYHIFASSYSVTNQLEGCVKTWKKLRIKSPQVSRIKICLIYGKKPIIPSRFSHHLLYTQL